MVVNIFLPSSTDKVPLPCKSILFIELFFPSNEKQFHSETQEKHCDGHASLHGLATPLGLPANGPSRLGHLLGLFLRSFLGRGKEIRTEYGQDHSLPLRSWNDEKSEQAEHQHPSFFASRLWCSVMDCLLLGLCDCPSIRKSVLVMWARVDSSSTRTSSVILPQRCKK